MTLKVIDLPNSGLRDVAAGLRALADQIESGEVEAKNITMTTGDAVFHLGDVSDDLAQRNAVFNLQCGLYNLMRIMWK